MPIKSAPRANAWANPSGEGCSLYEKLTPEDKKRMGWTKEFDENVPKRIQMAVDANIRFDEEREKFW